MQSLSGSTSDATTVERQPARECAVENCNVALRIDATHSEWGRLQPSIAGAARSDTSLGRAGGQRSVGRLCNTDRQLNRELNISGNRMAQPAFTPWPGGNPASQWAKRERGVSHASVAPLLISGLSYAAETSPSLTRAANARFSFSAALSETVKRTLGHHHN